MRAPSPIATGALATAFACALLAPLTSCSGGQGELGELCGQTSDCIEGLQCFDRVCMPLCQTHIDCGDGYRCEENGVCAIVPSSLGDPCFREIDCGPGQACTLDATDKDGDGRLAGTCTPQEPGLIIGEECSEDAQCRHGTCALGHCTELCVQVRDCPVGLVCSQVPRLLADSSAPRFGACIQSSGVITHELSISQPAETIQIPVPQNAVSFAVVTEVDEEDHLAGVWRVAAPDGTVLYTDPSPTVPEEFYANPLRYQPAPAVSTLLVPNSPAVGLVFGIYEVDVASRFLDRSPGTALPRVRVLYKVGNGAALDLHFHFLNLVDHPCASAFDVDRLDATSAPTSVRFGEYLTELGHILESAGVTIGTTTYTDIGDRGDLDSLTSDGAGELFSLSRPETGISVFFVRSIVPTGVQAIVGGVPGPPLTPGTIASGIAIGTDSLCYRDWTELARVTAHSLARQMGLYYNRGPDGYADAIPDSDEAASNLMFYGDRGGTSLSQGQADVLRRYPGLHP